MNASNPTSSMYGKIATLIARQTETCSGAKRAFTTKNEQTQNMESAVQIQKFYMKLLLICHNEHTNDPKSITVQAVTTPVPSASVDIEEAMDDIQTTITQQQAQDDMGDCGKFVSSRNNTSITKSHPFFFCVQALAQVVISIQRIGLLDKFKDGFEGSILNVLSCCVYMNSAWMTPEAGCASGRGRQIEMVQSRMPAMSVLMHAAQTFQHKHISVMSWGDMVHVTALNWCSNPCPSVLYPNFVSQLVANTFDWSIWLVLLVFADFFKVPAMDLQTLDRMFSSESSVVDKEKCVPMTTWLASIGMNTGIQFSRMSINCISIT